MIDYFKSFISFISFDLGAQAYVLVAVFALSTVAIFIIELCLSLFCNKKRDTSYYLCYVILSSILTAYFAVEDYLGSNIIFATAKSIYALLTILVSLSTIFYMVLRAISNAKTLMETTKTIMSAPQKDVAIKSVQTKPYEYYFFDKKVDGYLDVSYLKGLICELKNKNLSESDFKQIEELELYLMNFISRQPNQIERAVLSEKLSMLIKKIALYAS